MTEQRTAAETRGPARPAALTFPEALTGLGLPPHPGGDSAKPLVIAHRGYSAAAPENTLAAVDAARAIGADLIEVDLGVTASGTPVVLHDSSVDRTTNGSGALARLTDEALSRFDAGSWFGPGFAGQRVTPLETLFRDVSARGGRLLLELKGDWTPGAVAVVADLVIEFGLADSVLAQSFSVPTLRGLRDLAPMVPRCLVRTMPRDEDRELVDELEAVAYNPSHRGLSARPNLIEAVLASGAGVCVWTVDAPAVWERLLAAGVSGIITNQPGRLQGYLAAKFDAI